ncbi:MAG: hypothetical protein ACREPW_06815 [Candidatus Binataceae bacterium]
MNELAIWHMVQIWLRGLDRNENQRARRSGRRASIPVVADAPEPGLLPEQQAGSLTAIVRGSVAAQRLEMNGIFYAPRLPAGAGAVGAPQDTKPLAAVFLHLRHERKALQFAFVVEAGNYFRHASNFDKLTSFQVESAQA